MFLVYSRHHFFNWKCQKQLNTFDCGNMKRNKNSFRNFELRRQKSILINILEKIQK